MQADLPDGLKRRSRNFVMVNEYWLIVAAIIGYLIGKEDGK
jgi:hypothetical protein